MIIQSFKRISNTLINQPKLESKKTSEVAFYPAFFLKAANPISLDLKCGLSTALMWSILERDTELSTASEPQGKGSLSRRC